MKRIRVRIEEVPITSQLRGDYINDKQFKRQFQLWLNGLWQAKDLQLTTIKNADTPPGA